MASIDPIEKMSRGAGASALGGASDAAGAEGERVRDALAHYAGAAGASGVAATERAAGAGEASQAADGAACAQAQAAAKISAASADAGTARAASAAEASAAFDASDARPKPKAPTARTLPDDELFFGHAACAGCGGALAVRAALKVLGPHAVAALPAGCMSAVGFNFPQLSFANNAMITPFAATASVISGIEAGLRAQGIKPDDCTVVGFAGDGGTADIGIQALSGTIDRNDDVLYICYDNEAYMNTGIQKSSLTPYGASTTTTPVGSRTQGCLTQKKNLFEIIAAHGIPYAATASVGYLPDFLAKVQKAKGIHGTRFIHVLAPCPTGWGHATDATADIAKEAVDCGLWFLAEYEGPAVSGRAQGRFALSRNPKEFTDVRHYLRGQKRFRHMTDDQEGQVIAQRDAKWAYMREAWSAK